MWRLIKWLTKFYIDYYLYNVINLIMKYFQQNWCTCSNDGIFHEFTLQCVIVSNKNHVRMVHNRNNILWQKFFVEMLKRFAVLWKVSWCSLANGSSAFMALTWPLRAFIVSFCFMFDGKSSVYVQTNRKDRHFEQVMARDNSNKAGEDQ